jgi:hypothetical protein
MKTRSLQTRIRHHRRTAARTQRYPEALRREILTRVRARRAGGESVDTIARSLGLSPWTVFGWLRDAPPPRGGFRPVQLVPAPARAALVTPQGYRLEGDAESLAAVLKALS